MFHLAMAILLSQNGVSVTNRTVEKAVAVRCVNASGTAYESCAGAGGEGSPSGGLTNAELRATPVPVSGTTSVSNFPSTQAVTGTFWPGNQPVTGSVSVTNLPATQPVSGTVSVASPGTPWRCSLDNLAATLTQCQAAPAAGQRLYVTDIAVQTSTATSGTYSVQSGTGSNCATGTAAVWPALSTAARFNAPTNASMFSAALSQPLQLPLASALCVVGVATNTIRIQLGGYTAP